MNQAPNANQAPDEKRNYILLLLYGLFGQAGFALVNPPTFIPAYVMMLSGGSATFVGLALSLQAFGRMLSPFIGATVIESRRLVLPMAVLFGGAMRCSILLIALSGLLLHGRAALFAVMLSLMLFGVSQGMKGVLFHFLMSKVIPVSKRGRLTSLRFFLAGIGSAGVAWFCGRYVLGETPTPQSYSWIFLLAFGLTCIGLMLLLALNEPAASTVRPKQSVLGRIREVPALLRDDSTFARYSIARSIATMGSMAMPFYILFAGQSIGFSGQNLGLVTFAFTMSSTLSNAIWGSAADKSGFRANFLASLILWIVSTLVLMLSSGLLMIGVAFAFIGAAVQGFQQSSMNLTLEFGDKHDLPVRIAIANSASELAGILGPILGGLLAVTLGYPAVFVASIVFLFIGGIVVSIYVPEPRFKT